MGLREGLCVPIDRPRVGFHVSIAGGLPEAVERALERECTALQVFCGNPRAWALQPRPADEVEAFSRRRIAAGLSPLFVHACYLINPCAPDPSVYSRSIARMGDELRLAARMGADYYVIHPGSSRGRPMCWAVKRAATALSRALECAGTAPPILLETTASPSGPGGDFEALSEVTAALGGAGGASRAACGVALDSCHAFAAGYDFRRPAEVERMVEDIEGTVGMGAVRLLHVNDSRDEPGSGRDRHAHIGKGTIGLSGLRNLLLHPALLGLPLILETPWETVRRDLANIRAVRRLLERKRSGE